MDPGIQPTVLFGGPVGDRLHLLRGVRIGDDGRHLAAAVPDLPDQGGECPPPARGDDHLGAPVGERDGRLAADPAGSPRATSPGAGS